MFSLPIARNAVLDLSHPYPAADQPPQAAPEARLAIRAWTLFVDHVTASVIAGFEARQIESVLLKGPTFAQLLYDDPEERPYSDTDVLVKHSDVAGAEQSLMAAGFVRIDRDEDWIGPEPKYSHTFHRPSDGALVDLHWLLSGALTEPDTLWRELAPHRIELEVGGRTVAGFDPPACALLVALHNAHHGTGRPGTLIDLDRAVERLDLADWLDAVCLADELGAASALAAGLRLTEAGDALADRLGLDRPASVEMWLKANPSTYGAWVIDRLTQTNGWQGRVRICVQILLPPRVVMYRFFPLARRGRLGLILAYVMRPLRLLVHAGPAVRGWLRGRRSLRTPTRRE